MSNFNVDGLLRWYLTNKRDLPWRNTTDPYKVWLSEIILQQTRVNQGMPYYYKFIEAYPTVFDLASASLDEVYKLWEGLGYYSRANNLHLAAKEVVQQYNGIFPNSYSNLIKLKGIGDYTASAISSFCFKEVKPVLDGNVYRVLSRFYGISDPINLPQTQKVFKEFLNKLIPNNKPDVFNQAIMEFGALNCTLKKPLCGDCFLKVNCYASITSTIDKFPVKSQKRVSINRYFNYLVYINNREVFITKRIAKDIWRNLYEFPLLESKEIFKSEIIDGVIIQAVSKEFKHILSHQNIYAKFYLIDKPKSQTGEMIRLEKLNEIGVHRLMQKFIETTDWLSN